MHVHPTTYSEAFPHATEPKNKLTSVPYEEMSVLLNYCLGLMIDWLWMNLLFLVCVTAQRIPLALLPYGNSSNSQYDTLNVFLVFLVCQYTGLLHLLL